MPTAVVISARRGVPPGSFGAVSASDRTPPPPTDDERGFAQRLQAEISADAERRRREDPLLARAEREIERAWAHVAPPGAVGPAEELLLDRVDRLSLVDVDAPIGSRPGIRHVKGAIRKGTYWYLRYMSDQLNALHNVQARLLRRIDDRVSRLEAAAGIDREIDDLIGPAPVPGAAVGAAVSEAFTGGDAVVLVVACGAGECVGTLLERGVSAYGVDVDPGVVLSGIDAGLDLRVADPVVHLASIEPGTLGGVVLGGSLQRVGASGMVEVAASAVAACGAGGVVVVAPERIDQRTEVEGELLAGRGFSPQTWARVLDAAGATTEVVTTIGGEVADAGIADVVVARLP